MATEAHCLYCFEILSARLKKHSPLSLQQVESLWSKYNSDNEHADASAGAAEDSTQASAEADAEEDDEVDDDTIAAHNLRPRQISRLQNTSSNSSSSASTPSNSSSQNLSNEPSKSSSKSSLFSFITKSQKEEEYPLFVTWNILNSRGHKQLRGCIGTFDAQPLSQGLRDYALASAFEDRRFSQISLSELPSLDCGLTLLLNFTPCKDPLDWELGKHGIRISFKYHNRRYGSTFLPHVATEQGWDKEETLINLMQKAGWSSRSGDWSKVDDLKVTKYEGMKADVEYATYKAWREWADEDLKQSATI